MVLIKNKLSNWVVDWIFRVIAVVSLIIGAWAIVDTRNSAACQAKYNEDNNARSAALISVTDAERVSSRQTDDALGAFVTALIDPTVNQNKAYINELFLKVQQAYARQAGDRAIADKTRSEHPVLAPPSSKC